MPDTKKSFSYAICICTYKRTELVERLITDIFDQSVLPKKLIIVDGDPASGKVASMLENTNKPDGMNVTYIPSNHGNLSYQRYLGWKILAYEHPEYLIYFDDDLRINENDVTYDILCIFDSHKEVVGVTATTQNLHLDRLAVEPVLLDRLESHNNQGKQDSRQREKAGGYLPTGNRIPPEFSNGNVANVKWLQGRVMAYRFDVIDIECFSEDLFSLTYVNCGLGEDTFLSRQISRKGDLLIIDGLNIEHPDEALPNSYPIKAYNLAYATAFSRRFLNDHYRITEQPHISDRLALIKSYLGNNFLNIIHAVRHPASHRFAYARGYFMGSLRGIIQKPTAKNLTPNIDWYKDAEEALTHAIEIQ